MPNSAESSTHSARVQAVIDQPHLTDWYFSCRLADFVQHWLYDILDCDWHWYRLEYQAHQPLSTLTFEKLDNDNICAAKGEPRSLICKMMTLIPVRF